MRAVEVHLGGGALCFVCACVRVCDGGWQVNARSARPPLRVSRDAQLREDARHQTHIDHTSAVRSTSLSMPLAASLTTPAMLLALRSGLLRPANWAFDATHCGDLQIHNVRSVSYCVRAASCATLCAGAQSESVPRARSSKVVCFCLENATIARTPRSKRFRSTLTTASTSVQCCCAALGGQANSSRTHRSGTLLERRAASRPWLLTARGAKT